MAVLGWLGVVKVAKAGRFYIRRKALIAIGLGVVSPNVRIIATLASIASTIENIALIRGTPNAHCNGVQHRKP